MLLIFFQVLLWIVAFLFFGYRLCKTLRNGQVNPRAMLFKGLIFIALLGYARQIFPPFIEFFKEWIKHL